MTLIITELSKFGIAMVAETAVTEIIDFSGRRMARVLNGAQKLQQIPYLNAGISVWGLGSISDIPTDIWLMDFISQHASVSSIADFAMKLVDSLQDEIGDIKEPLGFHLAGYVTVNGRNLPTFYHVRNVDGTYKHYNQHEFIPGQDIPPREIVSEPYPITRNGDYGLYARLSEVQEMIMPFVEAETGVSIPAQSLTGRVRYHAAWVKFISDLYNSADLMRTIGANVSGLAIYPDQRMTYLTVV